MPGESPPLVRIAKFLESVAMSHLKRESNIEMWSSAKDYTTV
jgi:hypothetical protein